MTYTGCFLEIIEGEEIFSRMEYEVGGDIVTDAMDKEAIDYFMKHRREGEYLTDVYDSNGVNILS